MSYIAAHADLTAHAACSARYIQVMMVIENNWSPSNEHVHQGMGNVD